MMNPSIKYLTLTACLWLVACNSDKDPLSKPIELDGDTVATVNGIKITSTELDTNLKARQSTGQPSDPATGLEDMVNLELLRQRAINSKLLDDPAVAAQINLQTTNVLATSYIEKALAESPTTDVELQALYQKHIVAQSQKEYKTRHILSESKEEAEQHIAALDKGADFAKLATEKSTGPSKANGGDLGWNVPGTFVAPFSAAMQALKDGEYSKTPVETQFGWHVILVEQSRDSTPPSFESVSQRLRHVATSEKVQSIINELREAADVNITLDNNSAAADTTNSATQDNHAHDDHGHSHDH